MTAHEMCQHICASRPVRITAYTAGSIIVALLIFHAGFASGERHAFERLHHDDPGTPPTGLLPHGFIPDGHGMVGVIESVGSSTLTIRTRDGATEYVELSSTTVIHNADPSATTSTPSVGAGVIIIGNPDDSANELDARFVRLMPPPPSQP